MRSLCMFKEFTRERARMFRRFSGYTLANYKFISSLHHQCTNSDLWLCVSLWEEPACLLPQTEWISVWLVSAKHCTIEPASFGTFYRIGFFGMVSSILTFLLFSRFRVGGDFRYQEEEEPDSQPNFDVKPQAATISEGSPVRFLVRVSGKPTPRLSWYLNDQIVEPVSIFCFVESRHLALARRLTTPG